MISKSELNKIGDRIRLKEETKADIMALKDYRGLHDEPMLKIHDEIREALKEREDVEVVSRLKRLETIKDKLSRESSMELSRMGDIGGVRIIVPKLGDLFEVEKTCDQVLSRHCSADEKKDYIKNPKSESGYRSIHYKCKYNKHAPQSNRTKNEYDGLQIEVQLRTHMQHVWATSVEIVDLMKNEQLKRGTGDRKWTELFMVLSDILASVEYIDAGYVEEINAEKFKETIERLAQLEKELDAVRWFNGCRRALRIIEQHISEAGIFIVAIDNNKRSHICGYSKDQDDEAKEYYNELEEDERYIDRVLIRASDVEKLKKAYPNYFSDTESIVDILKILSTELGRRKITAWLHKYLINAKIGVSIYL